MKRLITVIILTLEFSGFANAQFVKGQVVQVLHDAPVNFLDKPDHQAAKGDKHTVAQYDSINRLVYFIEPNSDGRSVAFNIKADDVADFNSIPSQVAKRAADDLIFQLKSVTSDIIATYDDFITGSKTSHISLVSTAAIDQAYEAQQQFPDLAPHDALMAWKLDQTHIAMIKGLGKIKEIISSSHSISKDLDAPDARELRKSMTSTLGQFFEDQKVMQYKVNSMISNHNMAVEDQKKADKEARETALQIEMINAISHPDVTLHIER